MNQLAGIAILLVVLYGIATMLRLQGQYLRLLRRIGAWIVRLPFLIIRGLANAGLRLFR